MINGLLVVNKPPNVTSRDVVNMVSKVQHTKKIGHTGTLDPLATGVLVLTIGNATKLSEIIVADEKEYIAEVKMGIKTDTLDITGTIVEEKEFKLDKIKLEEVLLSFLGSYNQEVPIYSAVKINGKKLYEYARNNEEVVLPSRLISIYDIELLEITNEGFKFRCIVSKGTYIRSLINDICTKLNTVGVMSSLIRTRQGNYDIKDSFSVEDIKAENYNVIPIEEVLKDITTIDVDEKLKFKIVNGQIIDNIYNKDLVVFRDTNLLAIYHTYNKDETKLKPFKMF